ncbi:MAG: hypothetical protein ACE5PM_01705 [Candidatus Hydrothermarchaeales archaeon]
MFDRCPGTEGIKNPTIEIINCQKCGEEIEIFTDEQKTTCPNCGETVFREAVPSCIDWCKYAKECVGEEKYNEFKGTKGGG